jgi:hypothetical protein
MQRQNLILPIFLTAFLFSGSGFAKAESISVIYFTSTPGSWIGQGQTLTIDGVTASRYYDQGAYTNAVTLSAGGYALVLVEPNHSLPTAGYYDGVTRWPFMGDGAGMWFTAPGRGDNQISGWFDVLEASYSPIDGSVASFAVNFKQYDETSTTDFTEGSIRYNSSIAVGVPEPSSAALVLSASIAIFLVRKSRMKTRHSLS